MATPKERARLTQADLATRRIAKTSDVAVLRHTINCIVNCNLNE